MWNECTNRCDYVSFVHFNFILFTNVELIFIPFHISFKILLAHQIQLVWNHYNSNYSDYCWISEIKCCLYQKSKVCVWLTHYTRRRMCINRKIKSDICLFLHSFFSINGTSQQHIETILVMIILISRVLCVEIQSYCW